MSIENGKTGDVKDEASERVRVKIPIDTEQILKKTPKKAAKKKKPKRKRGSRTSKNGNDIRAARRAAGNTAFPKHAISACLRIPKGILENNAGKECTDKEAAGYASLAYNGDIGVEISSATKYGLLERPSTGKVKPTDLLRRIVRPQKPNDEIDAMREGVQQAPIIGDVYKHYRGENLPEAQFLNNTAIESYGVQEDRAEFFVQVFTQSLEDAKLLENVGDGKRRVLDVTYSSTTSPDASGENLKKLSRGVTVQATDTCFVMQPFASPHGDYFATIYEPAIVKAGLKAVRADDEIFGTGKIIDQIWTGINSARVLVAEMTTRNANVFYELGLAHALRKPVILVSSNKQDVPFDIGHVRVIYYDVNDPFWGNKLIEKVAENILQALKDPTDAILFSK
jgi:hypothetical protein